MYLLCYGFDTAGLKVLCLFLDNYSVRHKDLIEAVMFIGDESVHYCYTGSTIHEIVRDVCVFLNACDSANTLHARALSSRSRFEIAPLSEVT